MKTLTCMIVDDEPLAVKMLEDFVSRTPYRVRDLFRQRLI